MKSSILALVLLSLLGFEIAMTDDSRLSFEGESGLAALDGFLLANVPPAKGDVLGITGFFGKSSPGHWLILCRMEESGGTLLESAWKDGVILHQRTLPVLPGQDVPDLPVLRESLRIDSGAIFLAATKLASERQIAFEYVRYQLRVRDAEREPVWMVSLLSHSQVQVGLLYFSATSGALLRESWPQGGKGRS